MTVRPLSTAVKCFDLIELIAELARPANLADLARLAGESRATTYQRLLTLTTTGWVDRLPDDTYRLSLRACRIACAALEQAGLGERALPILQDLTDTTSQTSSLVVLERGRLIIAQRVEASGILRTDLRIGAELSFADSGSGHVWLAFGAEEIASQSRFGDHTLVSDDTVAKVRSRGYALGGGGATLPGISVIAAPVFGEAKTCIASLSLVGPDSRFNARTLKKPLLNAAETLGLLFRAKSA